MTHTADVSSCLDVFIVFVHCISTRLIPFFHVLSRGRVTESNVSPDLIDLNACEKCVGYVFAGMMLHTLNQSDFHEFLKETPS